MSYSHAACVSSKFLAPCLKARCFFVSRPTALAFKVIKYMLYNFLHDSNPYELLYLLSIAEADHAQKWRQDALTLPGFFE